VIANRRQWQVGDLVIHAGEAKERRLLRVVVARLPDGRLRTVYQFKKELPEAWAKRVMPEWPQRLLDPKRFGISIAKNRRAA